MADRSLQVRVGVNLGNSTSQLKALNVNLKNTQSEFKKAGAGIKDFENTSKGTKAKIEMLNSSIQTQSAKLKVLKTQVSETQKTMQQANSAYEAQKKKVTDLKRELEYAKVAYGENSKQVKEAKKALDEATKSLEAKERAVISCDNRLVGLNTQINKTEAEIKSLKAQLKDAGNHFTEFANKASATTFKGIGTTMKGIGTALVGVGAGITAVGAGITAGITVPFNNFKKASIELGKEFEASMSKVQALSGASAEEMKVLENKAREMGSTTAKSAKDASEAFGYMALAGYSVDDMLNTIEPMLKLSIASNVDLARVSDLVTDSMSAMGKTTAEASHYMDVLAKASASANTNADAMMEAYITCGGTLKNLNVPLEESATWLGILANQGTKGSEAGNALNSILINLTSGAGQAGKALKDLGVSAYDENGKFKGLTKVIDELKVSLADCTDEQRDAYLAMIGGKTNIDTLNKLLAGSGEQYDNLRNKINEASGSLDVMALIMSDNLEGKVKACNSAFEEIQLTMFDTFGGVENLKASLALLALSGFNKLPEPVKKVILLLVNLVAIIGPIIAVIGGLTIAFGFLAKAIGGLVVGLSSMALPILLAGGAFYILYNAIKSNSTKIQIAIEELSLAIYDNFRGIKEEVAKLWVTMQEIWNNYGVPLIETIGVIIETAISFIASIMPGISDAFRIVVDFLQVAWETVGRPVFDAIMWVVDLVVGWFQQYLPTIAQVFNSVMSTLKNLWETVGRPVFKLLGAVVEGVIEACKPILMSLKDTFGKMVDGISSVWNGILKPVFEMLIEVCGWLLSKAMPHIESFKNGVSNAMKAVLSPIQWVIDKFSDLLGWVGRVGDKVGGFLDKINPFSRSVEVAVHSDEFADLPSTIDAYNNMARSGQYYNRSASFGSGINQIIQASNGITKAQSSVDKGFNPDGLVDAITQAIQSALSSALNIQVDTIIDGRQVAKATAKYMDSEISLINKRKSRLGGSF